MDRDQQHCPRSSLQIPASLSADEIVGKHFKHVLAEAGLEKIHPDFISGIKRDAYRFETSFVNHAEKTFTLDITVMPIVVEKSIVGAHVIAKNITEKKDLEVLLAQAYRTARIGGWQLDAAEQKLTWTPITRELHEVPPDYVPALDSAINFYKAGTSQDTIRRAVQECMKSGRPYDEELQIITACGNERWVRAIGEAEIKNGKCIRLYGTLQDIHERKTGEERLRKAYQEKVSVLESIGDAFFAVDHQGVVTYWNHVAETMLSMPRDKVVGRALWDVYADAKRLAFYTEYQKAVATRKPGHFQEFYPSVKKWLEASIYPSATGLSIYFKDITDEKLRMEEIENQNSQLREIAHIQSHEVRAPLARIMGLINIIDENLQNEQDLKKILIGIKKSASDLDCIIRSIVRKTEAVDFIARSDKTTAPDP